MPKASAREFHQSNRPRLVNALLALRKHSRVLRHRRAFADCFGANPVASALGSSTRRDPSAADRTYHGWSRRPLKTGTFYFARKRNFLLCLDTIGVCPDLPRERRATVSSKPISASTGLRWGTTADSCRSVFRTTRVLPADVYRIDGAKRLIHIRCGSCVVEGATSIAAQDNVSDASRRKACNKERPAGSTT